MLETIWRRRQSASTGVVRLIGQGEGRGHMVLDTQVVEVVGVHEPPRVVVESSEAHEVIEIVAEAVHLARVAAVLPDVTTAPAPTQLTLRVATEVGHAAITKDVRLQEANVIELGAAAARKAPHGQQVWVGGVEHSSPKPERAHTIRSNTRQEVGTDCLVGPADSGG